MVARMLKGALIRDVAKGRVREGMDRAYCVEKM